MEYFINWILGPGAGVLTFVEFLITLGTILATLWQAHKARTAAQYAVEATRKVRDDIRRINTVADFTDALAIMNEMKTLHRQGVWLILPDRYVALKKLLISIRTSNPDLSNNHKTATQNALMQFIGLERLVEKNLAKQQAAIDVPRINSIMAKQIDALQQVLLDWTLARNEVI